MAMVFCSRIESGQTGGSIPADRLYGGRDRLPIVRVMGRQSWQRLSTKIVLTGWAKCGSLQTNSLLRSEIDLGNRPPAIVCFKSGSLIVRHAQDECEDQRLTLMRAPDDRSL